MPISGGGYARSWKRKRTIARKLIALGVKRESVWRQLYAGRKSWWALSHTHAVDQGVRNAYFAKRAPATRARRHAPQCRRVVAGDPSANAHTVASSTWPEQSDRVLGTSPDSLLNLGSLIR